MPPINGHMVSWDNRRIFLAVARAASLSKAADTLGLSRSTIMRRITALEEELGTRLFERLPEGYFTTEAGDEMLHSAERIETEANTVDRRISGRDAELTGKIRIAIPGVLATHLLMPDFTEFARANPNIKLEIAPNYEMVDLAKREADVAIRVSNNPPQDLIGRRILTMARAAYVNKDYLPHQQSGRKKAPALSWIGWSDDPSSQQWMKETDFPDTPIGSIIEDPHATLNAIRAGLGMAVLPCFMGDATAGVYRMPPGSLVLQSDVWVLTHQDMRNTARIRKFTSFIADALLRHRALVEGKKPKA
ncbi:MAG: LysR family transcriptional regulator [Alphaproteobacteria bacterium]|nr:LysR family transcriptional regulator [Alphaproteobacteria bacterium]